MSVILTNNPYNNQQADKYLEAVESILNLGMECDVLSHQPKLR